LPTLYSIWTTWLTASVTPRLLNCWSFNPANRVGGELVIHVMRLSAFAYQPIEQIATSQVQLGWCRREW
jgi:hypothetical protein